MMFGAPDVWDALMRKIAGISAAYLAVQVEAGASAVQLFDSWAGALSPADYRRYVMPYSAPGARARPATLGVPRIHFGVGTGELLGLMGEAGADVVGVDWRVPLADGDRRVGGRAVQGNLDPSLVFAPTEVMLARAAEIVEAGRAAPGPRLQPRPRRAPLDRPRPARPADRVRARALSPAATAGSVRDARRSGPGSQAVTASGWVRRQRHGGAAAHHAGTPDQRRAPRRRAAPRPARSATTTTDADQARASRPRARPGSRRRSSAPGGATYVGRRGGSVSVIVDIEVWSAR